MVHMRHSQDWLGLKFLASAPSLGARTITSLLLRRWWRTEFTLFIGSQGFFSPNLYLQPTPLSWVLDFYVHLPTGHQPLGQVLVASNSTYSKLNTSPAIPNMLFSCCSPKSENGFTIHSVVSRANAENHPWILLLPPHSNHHHILDFSTVYFSCVSTSFHLHSH